MSFFRKLFGRKPALRADQDVPFLEHPTGAFDSALQAITDAMERLESMEVGDRWITFSGQGQGHTSDAYNVEDVPFRRGTFDLKGQTLDLVSLCELASLDRSKIAIHTDTEDRITLENATPDELARFLDAVFRGHFGIKPFDGEDDYAVGAEW